MIKTRFTLIILTLAIVSVLLTLSPFFTKEDKKVFIFAAVSLTEPLEEIKDIFYQQNNISIILNFGGSQTLAAQISRGASPDIFIPAGMSPYKFIKEKDIKIYSDNVLISNKLIFVSNQSINNWENLNIEELLTSAKINRIAIADPELAPAGQYSFQVLDNMKLLTKIEDKIIKTKNVRDAVNYMRLGLAEGVFAYNTDFNDYQQNFNKKLISEELYNKVQYPLIILNNSKDINEFLYFLNGSIAKDIFIKYGFSNP